MVNITDELKKQLLEFHKLCVYIYIQGTYSLKEYYKHVQLSYTFLTAGLDTIFLGNGLMLFDLDECEPFYWLFEE